MRDKLSALKVQTTKKPGRYADGGGLYLFIPRPGYKLWTYRFMLAGKPREMSLGPVSDISLAEARDLASAARRLTRDGKDPIEVRRETVAEHRVEQLKTVTFREAALDFLRTARVEQFKNDKHRKQWRSTLEQYAFPVLGDLPLQSIDTAIVLKAILPVITRTPETGSRLRGRIERVFAWAKAHKLFDGENPATRDVLRDALPAKPKPKHHPAMPYADLPAFMEKLRKRDSVSARALEFCILTATRTQETIGARWSEIDLDAGVWTIPASRMKAKRDHRVPLSPRAVELLKELNRCNFAMIVSGRVFPLSNMAMLELLRGMAGNGYTVHGFRSAFSDWARDRTGYPRDVIEMALAHSIKDKSEAAYRRGDELDKRRRLMAEWARYCEQGAAVSGTVTALRA